MRPAAAREKYFPVLNVILNNGTLASFRHSGESRNPESLVGTSLVSGFRRNDREAWPQATVSRVGSPDQSDQIHHDFP
jgi:hypothetical protein